jgi:predicted transcriptional regulator of viral defense system
MNIENLQLKTLGPISAKFVSALKEKGQSFFILKEAQDLLGKNSKETTQLIARLIKRQIVYPIDKGSYLLFETNQEITQLSNWPLISKALVRDSEYYISHYAAMRLHGMTTDTLTEIHITLPKRLKDKEIYHIKYHFILMKQANFWGIEQQWVSKEEKVNVSDLERTILDCLNRTEFCGGLIEFVKGFWSIHTKINWEKLIAYSRRYPNKAAVKRLGYIAESLGADSIYLQKLHEIIEDSLDYILLDPLGERVSKYYKNWYLRINIEGIQRVFEQLTS